jgi:ribose transport system ATP-binding protein
MSEAAAVSPSARTAPLLSMRGIQKSFAGVRALKGVDLQVEAGQVTALLGENGAGKSTLMKILGGVQKQDGGEILIDGAPVNIDRVAEATRHGIAFIHQELNLLDNLDVAGNIFLGREPLKGGPLRLIDTRQLHEKTRVLLKRLDLHIEPDTPLTELSIAQQQMVEIAKALSLDARLLIMDEPTSSLTQTETERLLKIVDDLRAHGVGVIYISHRLGEVEHIADRAVVLRDGANAGSLERSQISHDNMVRLMVGRDIQHVERSVKAASAAGCVEVSGLRTQRYPNKRVSFAVGAGEILGLAGLVGAGRSEVAQALFGVDAALEGSVRLNGQTLSIRSPQDAIRAGIYLVPEDRRSCGLITESSIRENMTLPALKRHTKGFVISAAKESAAVSTMCGRLKVKAPNIETRTALLSGGNQQKVVLAKWLALEPKLLIFDEPTRGIDVGAKAEFYDLMRKLADNGVAVLVISSEMEEVLLVSDRIAVMHEGAIAGVLERAECNEENIMHLAVGANSRGH